MIGRRMLLAGCLGTALVLGGAAGAQEKIDIAWGGSNPGGVMYYMVGVASAVFAKYLPDINITQVTTGGSTENTKRLIKGELDMGISYGAHVYLCLRQEGPFANDPPCTMIRGVAKAYEGPTYFVTLADSDIDSIGDLADRVVALGPPGSGTLFNCTNMLRALGILDRITPRMMTFADAGRALANGQIDALCQSSAPAAAVTELAETRGVKIVPFSEEELRVITETYPYYHPGVLPEGTYRGVPAVRLPFMSVYWVAHERVPADVVERMVEVAMRPEVKKELAAGHPAWAQLEPDIENFLKLGAPFHPGAEAYYRRAGLWPEGAD